MKRDGGQGPVGLVAKANEFTELLDAERACGRRVGLVPTMGALHSGHLSLIERAARECDVVAVTLFVNPLQFNDPSDLARYPRDLGRDMRLAGSSGADVVFAPSVEEIYPDHPLTPCTTVHISGVADGLEGSSRPGHFDGVATVVTKLFALAGRCRAYFGEKDFQQLAVVRTLVSDLCLPVEIVGCPTVREADGLAMSSRNARLDPLQRNAARCLHRSLVAGMRVLESGERDADVVRAVMRAEIALEPQAVCDYADVVDARTMRTPSELQGDLRLLVAVTVGDVRLIDNEGIVVGHTSPAPTLVAAGPLLRARERSL